MDMATAVEKEALLDKVRSIAAHIEQDRRGEALEALDELVGAREQNLFDEVGRLTRQLHEAVTNLNLDTELAGLTEHSIPDAKRRLDYVIQKTEESTHRTLTAVEEAVPVAEALGRGAKALTALLARFERREMTADEFRGMARELNDFLKKVDTDAVRITGHLSEVLMAQEYQDLTGQVIRRVIELVQEVEDNLVDLIRVRASAAPAQPKAAHAAEKTCHGPAIEGGAPADTVNSQDEVDDLLLSLGF